MTGVAPSEFFLLLLIGLVVLGPRRLPEIANKIGGWIGQARRMTRVMRRQLEEELNVDDIHNIKSPSTSQQPPAADDRADPAYNADEPEAHHIPNDDDSYSALHDEAEDDEAEDDEAEREQGA